MKTIHARSHVGEDGMLELRLATGVTGTDVDVIVVVQPIPSDRTRPDMDRQTWEQFVRDTAGSIQDRTFFRHEQGEGWKSDAERSSSSMKLLGHGRASPSKGPTN